MKVKFDFSVDAWLQNVEVEADSLEKAKEKLFSMSLQDLLDEGYVKDFNIKDLDYEIVEVTYLVHVNYIDYSVYPEDLEEDPDTLSDEEIETKISEIKNSLPKELDLEITCDPDNLEDYIVDAISDETGWLVNDYSYEIRNKK